MAGKRNFTCVVNGKEHGTYTGSSPSSAARKVVSKMCGHSSKKVEFHLREISQGSKKKVYGPYKGKMEKLKEPIELKGRIIEYKPVAKLAKKRGGEPSKLNNDFNPNEHISGYLPKNMESKKELEAMKKKADELKKKADELIAKGNFTINPFKPKTMEYYQHSARQIKEQLKKEKNIKIEEEEKKQREKEEKERMLKELKEKREKEERNKRIEEEKKKQKERDEKLIQHKKELDQIKKDAIYVKKFLFSNKGYTIEDIEKIKKEGKDWYKVEISNKKEKNIQNHPWSFTNYEMRNHRFFKEMHSKFSDYISDKYLIYYIDRIKELKDEYDEWLKQYKESHYNVVQRRKMHNNAKELEEESRKNEDYLWNNDVNMNEFNEQKNRKKWKNERNSRHSIRQNNEKNKGKMKKQREQEEEKNPIYVKKFLSQKNQNIQNIINSGKSRYKTEIKRTDIDQFPHQFTDRELRSHSFFKKMHNQSRDYNSDKYLIYYIDSNKQLKNEYDEWFKKYKESHYNMVKRKKMHNNAKKLEEEFRENEDYLWNNDVNMNEFNEKKNRKKWINERKKRH